MSKIIKESYEGIAESKLKDLVGKLIHVPTNMHKSAENQEGEKEVNIWFAGEVAGYNKSIIYFDFVEEKFLEESIVIFNVLLTDGISYALSNKDCVIKELSEDEFNELVTKVETERTVNDSILLMGRDF